MKPGSEREREREKSGGVRRCGDEDEEKSLSKKGKRAGLMRRKGEMMVMRGC